MDIEVFMIVGYRDDIESENENIAIALDWIKKEEWKTLAVGKYQIKGNDVYAMVQSYTSKAYSDGEFESHQNYIDVQMVIDGKELMYVSNDQALRDSGKGYAKENDIEFFTSDTKLASKIYMDPGLVCILFPEDFHKPCISIDNPMQIKKLVIKVRV